MTERASTDEAPISSTWSRLTLAAAAIITIVGSFLLPPPFVGSSVYTEYGKFFLAAVVGLASAFMSLNRSKATLRGWIVSATALLLLSFFVFFCYQWQIALNTREYATHWVVVGNQYTPDAQRTRTQWEHDGKSDTDEDLIAYYAGQVDSIWLREGVRQNRIILGALYIISLTALGLLILCVVQIVTISTTKGKA